MAFDIQSETFWQEWQVSDEELDRLLEIFLERNAPLTLEQMARALLDRMVRDIQERSGGEADAIYDPTAVYEVGTRLRFPRLGHMVGTVVGVREGYNPRYERFSVLQVQFPGQPEVREFVADFHHRHVLNFDPQTAVEELSADRLYTRFRDIIHQKLETALEESEEFVRFDDLWLPKGLLVDINLGNRNIAEAMIDVMGKPLPPEELLTEMEVPKDVARPILVFSVNYALSQDERFVNKGTGKKPLWYLHRLEA